MSGSRTLQGMKLLVVVGGLLNPPLTKVLTSAVSCLCGNRVLGQEKSKLIASLLSWRTLVLIGVGLHPAAVLSSDRTVQVDAAGRKVSVEQAIVFSVDDAMRQNSLGRSEGYPAGVPRHYNWYKGWSNDGRAQRTPPADFSAVTGWGQVYQQLGEQAYSNPDARVEVANARTYVHLRSTGEWALVQDQTTNPVVGGHFIADFSGNRAIPMSVTKRNGTASFAAPPTGYNDHFWTSARGTYRAGDVIAVYVTMDLRVTDPNLKLVADVGADWWRDATAPYLQDHSNNPGVGSSNWIKLSTEWRTLAFVSSNALLRAHLPPPLVRSNRETLTNAYGYRGADDDAVINDDSGINDPAATDGQPDRPSSILPR